MFVLFWDMHSGGSQKLDWSLICIEAKDESEAASIFYSRFNRSPYRVTCTCCGGDYSIREYDSIEDAFDYHDNHSYDKKPDRLIILADEITDEDRRADVPSEGYVWM